MHRACFIRVIFFGRMFLWLFTRQMCFVSPSHPWVLSWSISGFQGWVSYQDVSSIAKKLYVLNHVSDSICKDIAGTRHWWNLCWMWIPIMNKWSIYLYQVAGAMWKVFRRELCFRFYQLREERSASKRRSFPAARFRSSDKFLGIHIEVISPWFSRCCFFGICCFAALFLEKLYRQESSAMNYELYTYYFAYFQSTDE